MISSVKGALTMVDLNTDTPLVYWKGTKVPNVSSVAVLRKEIMIRLVKQSGLDELYSDIESTGIELKFDRSPV